MVSDGGGSNWKNLRYSGSWIWGVLDSEDSTVKTHAKSALIKNLLSQRLFEIWVILLPISAFLLCDLPSWAQLEISMRLRDKIFQNLRFHGDKTSHHVGRPRECGTHCWTSNTPWNLSFFLSWLAFLLGLDLFIPLEIYLPLNQNSFAILSICWSTFH